MIQCFKNRYCDPELQDTSATYIPYYWVDVVRDFHRKSNVSKSQPVSLHLARGLHNTSMSPRFTCRSHFSTAPLARFVFIWLVRGTLSFSTLFMLVITRSSVKVSVSIPSKHFLRCGCTRRGSFVSDRISSIYESKIRPFGRHPIIRTNWGRKLIR